MGEYKGGVYALLTFPVMPTSMAWVRTPQVGSLIEEIGLSKRNQIYCC